MYFSLLYKPREDSKQKSLNFCSAISRYLLAGLNLRAEDRLSMMLMNRWGPSHTFKRHKSPSSRQEVVQVYVSVAISFSHFHPQLPSPAPLSGLEDYSPQISVNHVYAHPLVNPRPPSTHSVLTHGAAAADLLLSSTVPGSLSTSSIT